MSRAVWKVRFPFDGRPWNVVVPVGATILPVLKVDHDTLEAFAWFDVDTDAFSDLRSLVVVGTGQPIPEEQGHRTVHVASTIADGSSWHLFETRAVR